MKRIKENIHAFILGVIESDSDVTTHFDDWELLETYDRGRNLGRFLRGIED